MACERPQGRASSTPAAQHQQRKVRAVSTIKAGTRSVAAGRWFPTYAAHGRRQPRERERSWRGVYRSLVAISGTLTIEEWKEGPAGGLVRGAGGAGEGRGDDRAGAGLATVETNERLCLSAEGA